MLDVDERSKKGNVVKTYQVPAERFTNVEVSLQCHSYHSVNAPWRYIEMFLRIICQGSRSHSAWQDDPLNVWMSFLLTPCVSCWWTEFYAMLIFSRTCESYLCDGKYEGEEDGVKPETPHVNGEHTGQAKYPNLTHLKRILLIICRFWWCYCFSIRNFHNR